MLFFKENVTDKKFFYLKATKIGKAEKHFIHDRKKIEV